MGEALAIALRLPDEETTEARDDVEVIARTVLILRTLRKGGIK
jgi:hypothetical protein